MRRIEATAGIAAYDRSHHDAELLKSLASSGNVPVADLLKRFDALQEQVSTLEKKLKSYRDKEAGALADTLAQQAKAKDGLQYVITQVNIDNPNDLRELGAKVAGKIGASAVVVLAAVNAGKVSLVANCGADAIKAGKQAGKIVADACGRMGGKGGGKPDAAMGGGVDASKLAEALSSVS